MKKSVMKKCLGLVVALTMLMQCFCGVVFAETTLRGLGTSDSPYQIGTYEELIAFRDKVNGGETTAWATLINDIEVPLTGEYIKIGSAEAVYSGTFDGANHKVSYGKFYDSEEWYSAFFKYTNGATIKNLTIEGNTQGRAYAAGFVGNATNTTITNCTYKGNVSGTDYVNGFIGISTGNTIKNCAFIGDVTGSGPTSGFAYSNVTIENSYLVGNVKGNKDIGGLSFSGTVTNCYVKGTITASQNCVRISNGTVTNCYYLNAVAGEGYHVIGWGDQKSEDSFESGEVAYLLGDSFGQTIGTDAYPVFRTEANVVYKTAIDTYTNDKTENGTDIPYTIKSYTDLSAFRAKVNDGTATDVNVKLGKDIDLSAEIDWTPIGTSTNTYKGTFDGNGYSLKNLSITSGAYKGLFGYTAGATIKNTTIYGNVGGSDRCAGFVAVPAVNGTVNTTIEKCAFYGNVVNGNRAAFFASFGSADIKNCYAVGNLTGTSEVGAIGFSSNIENCFVYGTITTSDNNFKLTNNSSMSNSYYLEIVNTGGVSVGYGIQKSADSFASGEVAILLGDAFGQTIGEDEHPVFRTETNAVYETAIGIYTNDNTENGTSVPYTIKTYRDMSTFRAKVNDGTAVDVNVKLGKDIDLSAETDWTPIGTSTNTYKGTFDGNGYSIKNLSITSGSYKGLFGYTAGATIKNTTVYGNVGGDNRGAGFVAVPAANGTVNTTIEKCAFYGDINFGNRAAFFASFGPADIKNCYAVGNLTGTSEVGAIGFSANVENCFVYGTITTSDNNFKLTNNSSMSNSYYLEIVNTGGVSVGYGIQKSADAFASGEVAYLLNKGAGEIVYGQTIGTDSYPTIENDTIVYKKLDGTYSNAEGTFAFINGEKAVVASSTDATAIVAQYSFDVDVDRLLLADPVEIEAGKIYNIDITGESGAELYKLFIWTDLEEIKPLAGAEIYEIAA